jgi:hypothetical protein
VLEIIKLDLDGRFGAFSLQHPVVPLRAYRAALIHRRIS